ncbi:MAG: acyl-CoA desaturase [Pseudomonadota bacterium]
MDKPRFEATLGQNASDGQVRWSVAQSLWLTAMTLTGAIGGYLTFSLEAVLVFLVTTAGTLCFGHSLGMHRLLIHRSYRTFKPIEYVFVWLGVLVGLGGPLGMMSTHDLRDWAQRQTRCHDYFAHRQPLLRDAWWQLHCAIHLKNGPRFVPEATVADDPVYRWLERTWRGQQLLPALGLYLLGDLSWVIWGICCRVSVSILGHWLVGYFAHNQGQRRWHVRGAGVQGYNVPWLGLITMGESWHNNHHAFPNSARIGLYPGQSDPGWWCLKMLESAGVTWQLRLPDGVDHGARLSPLPSPEDSLGATRGEEKWAKLEA